MTPININGNLSIRITIVGLKMKRRGSIKVKPLKDLFEAFEPGIFHVLLTILLCELQERCLHFSSQEFYTLPPSPCTPTLGVSTCALKEMQ